MNHLEFFVPGIPKTAGSKRFVGHARNGHAILIDDCRNMDWKNAVAWAAKATMKWGPHGLLTGPVLVDVVFVMPRPKGHYRTGKRAGELRDNAPAIHTGKPDATKLWRCAEDALTGIVWADDAQIHDQRVRKTYGSEPGVRIAICQGVVGLAELMASQLGLFERDANGNPNNTRD